MAGMTYKRKQISTRRERWPWTMTITQP